MCEKVNQITAVSFDQVFFYSASKYEAFFQEDHYFRDDLYTNSDRKLSDYTDNE
jgi:hypothetical protein